MKDKVYSFDVFDTSITRIWARPTHLFWELGDRLQQENLIQVSPRIWSELRIEAERVARETGATGEVTLEEIYQLLSLRFNWSEIATQKAREIEIELELSSLRPIPVTQQKIYSLYEAGKRIIYISDMYLSEAVIQNFLKENRIWTPGSNLYVSSAARVNKISGKLFQHCLAAESLQPSQLHHCGDNLHADIAMSKKLGISSEVFSQAHLNRYEEKIADANRLPLKFRSLLAGTTRLTRVHSRETSPHRQIIWNTTASAIAPTLFGFVYWCLVEAEKKGIQRLYFVARDGQILLKIARIICQNWEFKIDCRYLYGSRQAWNFPVIQEIDRDEFLWLLFWFPASTDCCSVRSICDRVNISPEQIQQVLNRYGFAAEKWDRNLQQSDRDLLKQVFTDREVADLIISTAATYREKAIGYFRQEGLDDGVPFGFVDVGWSGRSQKCLSKLLDIAGIYPKSGITGFYFTLQSRVETFQNDCMQAYFHDVGKPSDRLPIAQYRCLFELFLAADHGSTTRYEQHGDRYFPILRSPTNAAAIEWGLSAMQSAALEFARQITTILTEQESTTDLFLEAAEILAKELVLKPSPEEAQVFGSFVISGDINENTFYELAPIYNLVDWCRLILFDRHPHADVWFPAAIARDNAIVRKLFKLKEIDLVRKLRKISGLGKIKQILLLQSQTT